MEEVSFFPYFDDGDVQITVGPDIYLLHARVLVRHSRWMRYLLTSAEAIAQAQCGGRVYLILVFRPTYSTGTLVVEERHDLRPVGEGRNVSHGSFLTPLWLARNSGNDIHGEQGLQFLQYGNQTASRRDAPAMLSVTIRSTWENAFKACYKIRMDLKIEGLDVGSYAHAMADFAENLEATGVIHEAVDYCLQDLGQELYGLIAEDPIYWVRLAVRIHSAIIYQEAVVHLTGKWRTLDVGELQTLPEDVYELCEYKHNGLLEVKRAVEDRILSHYPVEMHYGADERTAYTFYGVDVSKWMALSVLRQWLSLSIAENRSHAAPDGGAAFYRAIAAGGEAYLTRHDQAIRDLFPMKHDRAQDFAAKLIELKNEIKAYVDDLMVNRCRYDPAAHGELPYLTCFNISIEADIPWTLWAEDGWEERQSEIEFSESERASLAPADFALSADEADDTEEDEREEHSEYEVDEGGEDQDGMSLTDNASVTDNNNTTLGSAPVFPQAFAFNTGQFAPDFAFFHPALSHGMLGAIVTGSAFEPNREDQENIQPQEDRLF